MSLMERNGRQGHNAKSRELYMGVKFCVNLYLPPKRKVRVLSAQSCQTLCNPMDGSLPGSSMHRISQARKLEWFAMPFSRGSS